MFNPYTSRNMIKDSASFFGRQKEVQEIFANLENFQNTSVVGERRIGKSSLLWHISRPEIYSRYSQDERKPLRIVFFDLQKIANLTPETFFKLLAEGLGKQLPDRQMPDRKDYDTHQEHFYASIDVVCENYKIVICLDEFETIISNDQFDSNFLLYLRHFANMGKIAYITSSREPLEEICKNTSHLQGSDFWNIFVMPSLYLGLLKKDEAMQLITAPSSQAGIQFQPSDIYYIFELAGYHPLFLQIACFYLFESKKRKLESDEPADLTPLDLNSIMDDFLMGATPHFDHIWERLSQNHKKIIVNEVTVDRGGLNDSIRALTRKGLLTGNPPRPFCKVFEEYARKHYAPEREAQPQIITRGPIRNADSGQFEYRKPNPVPKLPVRNSKSAKLDIWIGKTSEVLINFSGPYSQSQICSNRTKIEPTTIKRFEARVRSLPQDENWRLQKQEIGQDVCDLFNSVPEVAQIYTGGRAAVDNDEQFLLTFRCPQEMLAFPFEFINCLSVVDEGQRHLILTHPVRKSLLGIRSKKRALHPDFFQDEEIRILLVSSNASGNVKVGNRTYSLPSIPGVIREVDSLDELIAKAREKGNIKCAVDVRHNVTRDDMIELLEQDYYDVLHFSGHGFYADSPENSCLFFCPEENRAGESMIGALSANELNNLVEHTRLKFLYLSCCQGAMTSTTDFLFNNDFLGIAHSLLVGGIPSVLSMRWPLSDDMAVLLATSFYNELLKGQGLETALFRARKHVQARMPNDYNWLSPVLVIQGD